MRFRVLVATALLLMLPSAAFAQPGAAYLIEDDTGDVAAGAAGTRQPVPSADTLPYIDVTKLEIRDLDEELVEFRLSNAAGFKAAPANFGSMSYIGLQQTRHRVHFTVEGIGSAPTKAYLETDQNRLRIENDTTPYSDVITMGVSLCVPLPGSVQCDFFSRFYLDFNVQDGVLVIPLPKEFLTSQAAEARSSFGGAGGASALPPRIYAGDKLTNLFVIGEEPGEIFATGLGMPTVDVQDRMPDEGSAPEFVFSYPSATNDLVIHYPPWSVIAGEENVISIQVDNKAPVKRIVNFSLEQDAGAGDPWPMSISPTATLPAGQSTNITLRAKAPPLVNGVGDWAIIKIRGDVITQPGNVGIRTSYLTATAPLDKDHDTFFFYGQTFGSPLPAGPSYGFGQLTRLEAVAAAWPTPVPFNNYLGFGPGGNGLYLMQYAFDSGGIPNVAKFRPGESGQGQFDIESPAAFEGSVSLQLLQDSLVVAQHVGEVSVAQGRTTVEFPLPILPDVTRLDPANGSLFLSMELTSQGPAATAVNALHFAGQEVNLIPATTWFQLPIDRDTSIVSVAAPFKVSLAAAEDLESFINPGKTQVFEFDLRNEETRALRIDVTAENKSADWPIEVRPGARYKLAGNESAHLGVLVTAPGSAKEGAQLLFQVRASDADSGLPVAIARIHVIVTSGVDIENETFEATSEDAAKVEGESKKSPGLHWVGAIAVVATVAVIWRRRQ